MKKGSAFQELQCVVENCNGFIVYSLLAGEVDFNDFSFPLEISDNKIVVPNNKNSDPFEWAEMCVAKFKNEHVCVLIPGKMFDMHGIRHGKGGGWYDRFLSVVPHEWIRIGVADISQISETKLVRQKWDESMDWLVVRDGDIWDIYKV